MKKTTQKNLWFRRPAEGWIEGLPIGNGRMGAMVEGGINRDHMYLNEESVWAGYPGENTRTDGAQAMKKIRECLFAGDYEPVEELVMTGIMPKKRWFGSYQVLGELEIRSLKTLEYIEYERNLDLDTGTVEVRYTGTGEQGTEAQWEKEYFASSPRQVIGIHYTCSGQETLDLEIGLSREEGAKVTSPKECCLLLSGQCKDGIVRFAGMVKAVFHGGTMKVFQVRQKAPPVLRIHGARSVELYVSARTDYNCASYEAQCEKDVEAAAALGYEAVKQEHIREYSGYYSRFDIGFKEQESQDQENVENLTTYQRLKRLRNGGKDENFYALMVNYHRYILLSSSRPGCLPSNLQGLWNHQIFAPWESDYHANINLEMNYWPVEGYHLGECHQPLFDWLQKVKESGEKTARDYYGARGWVLHHASNLFAHTAPCAVPAGLWPMGGAWLARHLYEHYLYTGDRDFLREQAYPLMKGAAVFILDFLTPAPEGVDGAGYLVTNPSHSPENRFYTKSGKTTTFTYGATMDFEIIRDLFLSCLDTIACLGQEDEGFEKEFAGRLAAALKRLPPVCISPRTGGIQEWIGDYKEADPGHRHISHLYGLYPARLITREKTPNLAQAAQETLERKLSNNYDGQGWSYGWISCLWARLGEGERAYEALSKIVKNHAQHNLFLEAHGNPQVGDAQGIPAAVLEMLVQFDGEKNILLPALPRQWQTGWVRGLRLIGGLVIDMDWEKGKIKSLTLHREKEYRKYPLIKPGEG